MMTMDEIREFYKTMLWTLPLTIPAMFLWALIAYNHFTNMERADKLEDKAFLRNGVFASVCARKGADYWDLRNGEIYCMGGEYGIVLVRSERYNGKGDKL